MNFSELALIKSEENIHCGKILIYKPTKELCNFLEQHDWGFLVGDSRRALKWRRQEIKHSPVKHSSAGVTLFDVVKALRHINAIGIPEKQIIAYEFLSNLLTQLSDSDKVSEDK